MNELIINKLIELSKKYPAMRLGQLFYIVATDPHPINRHRDLYYISNEELMDNIENRIKNGFDKAEENCITVGYPWAVRFLSHWEEE